MASHGKLKLKKTIISIELCISLHCTKKGSSQWSYVAQASVKVLSFDRVQNAMEKLLDPHIFCNIAPYFRQAIIDWDILFDDENNYVQNDTINLNVTIKVLVTLMTQKEAL